MTKNEDLIKKIEEIPYHNDIKFGEIKKYLEHFGFTEKNCNGSHHVFVNEEYGMVMVIPAHGRNTQIKAIYIKKSIERVRTLKEQEEK